MQEDLLHFIWKYKRLPLQKLVTTKGLPLEIVDVGGHNLLAGPDFFNARLRIDGQLWAGNVEIHLRSSHWYAHHHELDDNYDSVILHVVWEDDAVVFGNDNREIPTLELKDLIQEKLLQSYSALLNNDRKKFINCERDIGQVDGFVVGNWLERLYVSRLEQKSTLIMELLQKSHNDWEKVLFNMLLKGFGSNINGDSFLGISEQIDFGIVRKIRGREHQLECLLMGMAGLLEDSSVMDTYYLHLKKEFAYLSVKYKLNNISLPRPDFFKLRPSNFPTVRLAQAAALYNLRPNLFGRLMEASDLGSIYKILGVRASPYWDTHFTFGKPSRKSVKKLTRKFMDLLVINTLLPIRFCYERYRGMEAATGIYDLIANVGPEHNAIISHFHKLGLTAGSALESQAILQLYNAYCTKNKCLQCAIGASLLGGNK
tara:strand:+ start:138322 stop:139605 length:1284 start_codon:yes stop_codon:yes gene_type:complete